MTARDLLAAATPRPWEGSWPIDEGGKVLTLGGYREVASTIVGADAALIVAAVNEYEALNDIAAAAEAFLDSFSGHIGDSYVTAETLKRSLARLDAARSGS